MRKSHIFDTRVSKALFFACEAGNEPGTGRRMVSGQPTATATPNRVIASRVRAGARSWPDRAPFFTFVGRLTAAAGCCREPRPAGSHSLDSWHDGSPSRYGARRVANDHEPWLAMPRNGPKPHRLEALVSYDDHGYNRAQAVSSIVFPTNRLESRSMTRPRSDLNGPLPSGRPKPIRTPLHGARAVAGSPLRASA